MRMKKLLSLFLALVMVLSLVPATVLATEPQGDVVYISVSHDGQFIDDKNGSPMAYVGVALDDLTAINLDTYGLSDYKYDKDGDGNYEITSLHLYIYVHEILCGQDWSAVTVTGSAGSIYFEGGLFGYEDENLRYNYNGAYPADESGWGLTADQLVLSDGDYFDVAHYTDWNFYSDTAYGFHYFTDDNGNITLDFAVEAGETVSANLILVGGGMGGGDTTTPEAGYTVYYGKSIGSAEGNATTDDNGNVQLTFEQDGTYYIWCDGGEGIDNAAGAIVSSPASATVTVAAAETPETPREAQDVSTVLNATMAKLAATVTAPAFGTNAGEWTVLGLARGGYYTKDNAYFTDYYNRIVETVNTTSASVNLNGALHKSKSTENSRLIVALSAIGKDATAVGNWDLVEAYSANGFSWIKKQGINGTIWALIALDSNNYTTTDATIRQQCVDSILSLQHDDGGWSLMANKTYASDPDVTGMALTALYPYRNQPEVAAAAEEAFACLSAMQHDNGTFASGGAECSESCAWVIVSTTMWGINPDTDSRFIKNGKSVVDGLLAHYLPESATFQHIIGAGSNAMATDQSCYALVAYDRFINNKAALYDYSDVTFDAAAAPEGAPAAALGLPEEVVNDIGTTFNANVTINKWGEGYKLLDMVMTVPAGLDVASVTPTRLNGGTMSYHLETLDDGSGKLRLVYFDADNNADITIKNDASDNAFPAEMFTVEFEVVDDLAPDTLLNIAITGMSLKTSSDSSDEEAQTVVDTAKANGEVKVVEGISFSAKKLYQGDAIDLIPADKMAVAVAVTGLDKDAAAPKLTFKSGDVEIVLTYSAEMHAKTGVHTYVALVDAAMEMESFTKKTNYVVAKDTASAALTFGETNGDNVVNAQDALAAVNAWLRKTEVTTDTQILVLNVNGDARINTFDALGIVESFVHGSEFAVVTMALSLKPVENTQQ